MIVLDPTSPTAPYEQLRAQLALQITGGELSTGARLPTVRRLAEDLGLAANTVARAYRELEAAGLVETRGRNGAVVAWSPDTTERELQQAAVVFTDRARSLGVDPAEALRLVQRLLGT